MKILNQKADSILYTDVVEFCKEGNIEGVQLDYKREVPAKGLAKHFASFSNTRGGIIIIGVSEDRSGKPEKFEGIVLDSKLVDKIHQYASFVEPRPVYDLAVTAPQNGKVFILVRIYEGYETPYYVQNDPNIYVRTGNITDPIDIASPKTVELLFGKREKAQMARENCILRAQDVYESALTQGEKERLKLIAIEKENYEIQVEKAKARGETIKPYESQYFQEKLGSLTSIITLLLQPYYPKDTLVLPSEIKSKVEEIRFTSNMGDFPNFNLDPTQDGVINFEWNESSGHIECQQLYSHGLLFHAEDILRQDAKYGKRIYIEVIASNIFIFLRSASKFYTNYPYQGSLVGSIMLEGIDGAKLKRIVPNNYRPGLFWDREKETPIMDRYEWQIEIDTSTLSDDSSFQNYFIKLIQEIYWSLGYENPGEDLLKAFLKDNRWLYEER